MDVLTVVSILIGAGAAFGLAWYQYFYQVTDRSRYYKLLFWLRFLGVFFIILAIINPRFNRTTLEVKKPILAVVADNSLSIKYLKAESQVQQTVASLQNNSALNDKFELRLFTIDEALKDTTAFDFSGKSSNLHEAASGLQNLFRGKSRATVLVSDGNQTGGSDFVYSFGKSQAVFSVVAGDTLKQTDAKIAKINVNKFAFKGNQFPFECFVQYTGKKASSGVLQIKEGAKVVFSQNVDFNAGTDVKTVSGLLQADKIGSKVYTAVYQTSISEKNKYNNNQVFAVEIVDQRAEIAIVSTVNHPDLGALKRAIETNAQRKVTILKPYEALEGKTYNAYILYQPNQNFKKLWTKLENDNQGIFFITGMSTDFPLLNTWQSVYNFKMSAQTEDYRPSQKTDFTLFAQEPINVDSWPPLQNPYGTISPSQNRSVLFSSRINNIETGVDMFAFAEAKGRRLAFLFGEDSWKWRLADYAQNRNFEAFDLLIDKTIQYLTANQKKSRLLLDYEKFYNSGTAVEITAQAFNKNFEFDREAELLLSLTQLSTNKTRKVEMPRGESVYKSTFDNLSPGKYRFTVTYTGGGAASGYFEVLDYDVERQFVNADFTKMSELATQTSGGVFLANQTPALIDKLLNDKQFKAVQKETSKSTSWIDLFWCLLLSGLLLGAEWFLRKYRGLS